MSQTLESNLVLGNQLLHWTLDAQERFPFTNAFRKALILSVTEKLEEDQAKACAIINLAFISELGQTVLNLSDEVIEYKKLNFPNPNSAAVTFKFLKPVLEHLPKMFPELEALGAKPKFMKMYKKYLEMLYPNIQVSLVATLVILATIHLNQKL